MREILESEIATELPGLLSVVERESIAIRSDGAPVAYLVSPRQFESTNEFKRQKLLEASRALSDDIQANVAKHGLDLDELMRDLDRKRK
jgi:PHD/YefM family antitoxin component YafN of YafNO toxin-antitoxin module